MFTLTAPSISINLTEPVTAKEESRCSVTENVPPHIWENAARLGRTISEWSHVTQTTVSYTISSHMGCLGPASQRPDEGICFKCVGVYGPCKIATGDSLSKQTHVHRHDFFCFVFLKHDLYIFLHLEDPYSISPCFCLSLVMAWHTQSAPICQEDQGTEELQRDGCSVQLSETLARLSSTSQKDVFQTTVTCYYSVWMFGRKIN